MTYYTHLSQSSPAKRPRYDYLKICQEIPTEIENPVLAFEIAEKQVEYQEFLQQKEINKKRKAEYRAFEKATGLPGEYLKKLYPEVLENLTVHNLKAPTRPESWRSFKRNVMVRPSIPRPSILRAPFKAPLPKNVLPRFRNVGKRRKIRPPVHVRQTMSDYLKTPKAPVLSQNVTQTTRPNPELFEAQRRAAEQLQAEGHLQKIQSYRPAPQPLSRTIRQNSPARTFLPRGKVVIDRNLFWGCVRPRMRMLLLTKSVHDEMLIWKRIAAIYCEKSGYKYMNGAIGKLLLQCSFL